MSPRRMILRELSRRQDGGGASYTRPGTITGFTANPGRYQAAVNALLQERLINGTKDADGRLAIAINTDRIEDVRREIRPIGARPTTWFTAVAAIALVVVAWVVL